jgi:YD repeat-containing protein
VKSPEDHAVLEDAVKVIYDKDTDTLSIILRLGKVAESDQPHPGLILDYDKAGRLVSIELLDASEQVKSPQSIEFALSAED